MMPVASSQGVNSVRAAISASSNTSAPHRADSGTITRKSTDTRRRMSCGTTRPIKPIGPARETAVPQSSAMASRARRRVFSSDTPSPCAILSPSASMLSEGDSPIARTKPAAAAHRALWSICALIPAISPASQVRRESSVCSSRINTAAVIDEANADIATPHRVTFIGVNPVRPDEENISTSRNSAAAPAAAISGRPNGSESPSALAITTASAAPALSPRICGSPSGLRITDCSSTPATPSAAPVTIAAQRRSSRSLMMMLWSKLRGSK